MASDYPVLDGLGATIISAANKRNPDEPPSRPVGGEVASGAADSGNPVKVAGVYRLTKATLADGQRGDLQLGTRGSVAVTLYGEDSAATITGATPADGLANPSASSNPNIRVSAFNNIMNGTTWDRFKKPNAVSRIASSAATTNPISAKASAGDLFSISGKNNSGADIYVKLYNKASAPTVGTDTPFDFVCVPPGAFAIDFPTPLYFSTGIAYGMATGAADASAVAVAAGDITALALRYA